MTQNSLSVFNFLKKNYGLKLTVGQVRNALNLKNDITVIGSVNGLCKKGYAGMTSEMIPDMSGELKKTVFVYLTEEGLLYNPE